MGWERLMITTRHATRSRVCEFFSVKKFLTIGEGPCAAPCPITTRCDDAENRLEVCGEVLIVGVDTMQQSVRQKSR